MGELPPLEEVPLNTREEIKESDTTRERVFKVGATLTEPARVSEIAERAQRSKAGVRTHLEWLVQLCILDRVDGSPIQYVRNEAYFEFRRVTQLIRKYESPSDVEDTILTLQVHDEKFQDYFDTDGPDFVSVTEVPIDDIDVATICLDAWRDLRQRITDLETALERMESQTLPQ